MMDSKGWQLIIHYNGPNESEYSEEYNIYVPRRENLEPFNPIKYDNEFTNIEKRINQIVEKYDIVLIYGYGINSKEEFLDAKFWKGEVAIYCSGMKSIKMTNCSKEKFIKAIFDVLEKVKKQVKVYCLEETRWLNSRYSRT